MLRRALSDERQPTDLRRRRVRASSPSPLSRAYVALLPYSIPSCACLTRFALPPCLRIHAPDTASQSCWITHEEAYDPVCTARTRADRSPRRCRPASHLLRVAHAVAVRECRHASARHDASRAARSPLTAHPPPAPYPALRTASRAHANPDSRAARSPRRSRHELAELCASLSRNLPTRSSCAIATCRA